MWFVTWTVLGIGAVGLFAVLAALLWTQVKQLLARVRVSGERVGEALSQDVSEQDLVARGLVRQVRGVDVEASRGEVLELRETLKANKLKRVDRKGERYEVTVARWKTILRGGRGSS